jgi:hypothetical protein
MHNHANLPISEKWPRVVLVDGIIRFRKLATFVSTIGVICWWRKLQDSIDGFNGTTDVPIVDIWTGTGAVCGHSNNKREVGGDGCTSSSWESNLLTSCLYNWVVDLPNLRVWRKSSGRDFVLPFTEWKPLLYQSSGQQIVMESLGFYAKC